MRLAWLVVVAACWRSSRAPQAPQGPLACDEVILQGAARKLGGTSKIYVEPRISLVAGTVRRVEVPCAIEVADENCSEWSKQQVAVRAGEAAVVAYTSGKHSHYEVAYERGGQRHVERARTTEEAEARMKELGIWKPMQAIRSVYVPESRIVRVDVGKLAFVGHRRLELRFPRTVTDAELDAEAKRRVANAPEVESVGYYSDSRELVVYLTCAQR